jgi:hypothetical protein
MWTVHQMSVAEQGNFHVAEAAGGRTQEFRPRKHAKTDSWVGHWIGSKRK